MEVDEDPIIQGSLDKLKTGASVETVLEPLYNLEKQARNASDLEKLSKILPLIVEVCYESTDWDLLNENIHLLAKKRGQLKQATVEMVRKAITYIHKTPSEEKKLRLLETLRSITLGKIFLEIERAHVTKFLSEMKEKEGKLKEAVDILFELQIETFGSMERTEKTTFLLDQMRLGLLIQDYVRTQIISKKISAKSLSADTETAQKQKLEYYQMMIQLALHEKDYLQVTKQYLQIYEMKNIKENQETLLNILKSIVIYTILSPYNNEQSDLSHRLSLESQLTSIPLYKSLLQCFLTKELMRWPMIEKAFSSEIFASPAFESNVDGIKSSLWLEFKERVIEHNIRIISSYYRRIKMERLAVLLDSDLQTTEESLSRLVVNKTIYARLDRPAGIVLFVPRKETVEVLNTWANSIKQLLDGIVKVNHLIAKEEMVYAMKASEGGGSGT